ncbi:MAG: DUF5625 family protein [Methylococcales bacterium]|nr:DUF5625 family protein [Methylococcales bacterium]
MNPITYSLCHKPVIGMVMFITSLCAFPPLFSHIPIALDKAGAIAYSSFSVPVTKKYVLEIDFEFPNKEAKSKDEIVGDRYNENCRGNIKYQDIPEKERIGLGKPILFRVIIRNQKNNAVITDKVFESLCVISGFKNEKTRTIGWLDLTEGKYSAEVINLDAQKNLEGVKTSIILNSGHGKQI